jgi:squalene cyclase
MDSFIEYCKETYRYRSLASPAWMTGWVQLALLRDGESRWHIGGERAHGLWSFSLHFGFAKFYVIGPFGIRHYGIRS